MTHPTQAEEREDSLAEFVEPEITEARIARQLSAIEQRGLPIESVSRTRFFWRLALVAVPATLVLALFLWHGAARPTLLGGSLMESAEAPIAVRLSDGSSVELDPRSRLRLLRDQPEAVELALGRGAARFDVTHVAGRSFTVSLGQALVTVVGTRFEVARSERSEGTLVRVSVTRGVVEVRRRDQPGGVRKLTAGESWSALLPSAAVAPASAPTQAQLTDAKPDDDDVEAIDDTIELDDVVLDEPQTQEARSSRARKATARARAIFQRANLARRAGQMNDAAEAYAELLKRHRNDKRAGLSAFELGRIRMDALGDPSRAVSAFNQALQLSPDAGFREDALARIVFAQDALGQHAACRKARDRYLAGYPQGVHVASLAGRCN
jgi:transmembrane sensor